MDDFLRSHCIAPELICADRFWRFFAARAEELLRRIEAAMGKTVARKPQVFRPGVVAEVDEEGAEEWEKEEPLAAEAS